MPTLPTHLSPTHAIGLPLQRTIAPRTAATDTATGGLVANGPVFADAGWRITTVKLKNTLVHELLHTLGLGHCNSDMNNDGQVASYDTVKDTTGVTPIMTSPNGGYQDSRAGTPTPYDLNGIKQLLANATARIGLPSGTTLSKVENAKRLVAVSALDAYFTAYGIEEDDARREEIRKLATLAGSTRRANLRTRRPRRPGRHLRLPGHPRNPPDP
ncbi:hypothetical protein AB0952_27360 [Streptomyces caniferus]|uniref:hypothetical protein n=1 Tax=Streptomyces caniferus TaxID=285557 RepID=UPI0034555A2D